MLIKKHCEHCSKPFERKLKPSDIKKGRGKYCSHKCYGASKIGKKISEEHRIKISTSCIGKAGIYKRTPSMQTGKYKRTKDMKTGKHMIGEGNHNWKGGTIKTADGYTWDYCPAHPFANSNKRVFSHRIIMESHLNRFLSSSKAHLAFHRLNPIISDKQSQSLSLPLHHQVHKRITV